MPAISARGVGTSGNLVNHTITFSAVASGDALIVVISVDNGEALTGIPGDATLDASPAGAFDTVNVISIPNITDGRTTFDFEIATQSSCVFAWYQVSGLATSAPFDQTIRTTAVATSIASGNITTGGDNYLGLYHTSNQNLSAGAFTAGSGYTLQTMAANYMAIQDNPDLGTAGVKSTSMSWVNSQVAVGNFFTYKAASGAPLTGTLGQFDPELRIAGWF